MLSRKIMKLFVPTTSQNHRQARVAHEIRHVLSEIFLRGLPPQKKKEGDFLFLTASITITDVKISPDLKNATVYFLPLAGKNMDDVTEFLTVATKHIRHLLSKKIRLRSVPQLIFEEDKGFEHAQYIQKRLKEIN